MKRTIASLLFLIGLSFAVTAYAEVVTYYNTFNVGKKEGQYRVDDGSAVYGTSLAPFYSNLRYYESGDSNLRFNLGEGYIKMANGSGKFGTLQMDASNFLSSATNYDLTLGDLVYECYNACSWNGAGAGGAHNGISINNNQMRFIYHPGYTNGAFRIEGDFGTCTNQNIGFTPAHNNDSNFTMMKLTIHRDDNAGNYVFTTQFGQATRTSEGWNTTGYTYSYVHTCPITTIDAAGGIKSIGPYGNHNNDACVTNLRLDAPFPDAAVAEANSYTSAQQYVISKDQPTHWYKFDDSSTNVIKDSGSSPVNGTARNIDMSAISDLRQVADVSGNYSQVDLTGTNNISGNWTAEFYINPSNVTGRQALTSGSNGSLRWIMNSGVPGFTQWGAYDQVFKGPDGVSNFSYNMNDLLNDWVHVAYVRENNSMFFYIDGELAGRYDGRSIDLPLDKTIGSNGTGELFSGMIDDIAFYSYALTAEQIMAHAFPGAVMANFYDVRSTDISAENWTIDGTNKKGVVFVEGEQDTATYANPVILVADGSFDIDADKNLILSGVVSGSGALEKIGAGTLTLSGDNDYTANMKVSEGTLALTGDALKANNSINIADGATLEYYVPEGEQQLTFTNGAAVSGANVIKTGDGKLKILASGDQFQSDLFTVEAGELDFKGQFTGDLVINEDAVFSPGNSVGHVDIDGDFILNGGTLLIEMDESGIDTMTANSFDLDNGTISFLLTQDIPWGSSYDILTATDDTFDEGIIDQILNGQTLPDYFSLYLAGDGSIVRMDIDRNAVPEPSTWALMILGAAGLLYWRKRK